MAHWQMVRCGGVLGRDGGTDGLWVLGCGFLIASLLVFWESALACHVGAYAVVAQRLGHPPQYSCHDFSLLCFCPLSWKVTLL